MNMENKSSGRKKEAREIYQPPRNRKPRADESDKSVYSETNQTPKNTFDESKPVRDPKSGSNRGRGSNGNRRSRANKANQSHNINHTRGPEHRESNSVPQLRSASPAPSVQSLASQTSRRSSTTKTFRRGGGGRARGNPRGDRDLPHGNVSRPERRAISPTDSLHSVLSASDLRKDRNFYDARYNDRNSSNKQRNDQQPRRSNNNQGFSRGGGTQTRGRRGINRINNPQDIAYSQETRVASNSNDVRLCSNAADKIESHVYQSSTRNYNTRNRQEPKNSRLTEIRRDESKSSPPNSEIYDFDDLKSFDTGPLNWSREVEEYNLRTSESEKEDVIHVPEGEFCALPEESANRPMRPNRMIPAHILTKQEQRINEQNTDIDNVSTWYQPKSNNNNNNNNNNNSRNNKHNYKRDQAEIPPRFQKRNLQHSNSETNRTAINQNATKSRGKQDSVELSWIEDQWPAIKGCVLELERQIHAANVNSHNLDAKGLIALSTQISSLYRTLILVNAEYTSLNNVDGLLWKHAFYLPSECLRHVSEIGLERDPTDKFAIDMVQCWIAFLNKSEEFYREMLNVYETKYKLKLESHIVMDPKNGLKDAIILRSERKDSFTKILLRTCQKFLIALGDLSRYKEMAEHSLNPQKPWNFSEARFIYLQSIQLFPGNGKPYNQLGLLARFMSRQLDSIYHFVRALSVKYPFILAIETLNVSFNFIENKVNQYEKQIVEEVAELRTQGTIALPDDEINAYRREVWIGGNSEDAEKIESKKDKEICAILQQNASTLYKRCHLYLLNAVGMIYTKINMDQFEVIAERGLMQLDALLHKDDSPLRPLMLAQIAVIMLSAVHKTCQQTEEGTVTLLHHRAVQLVFSYWGLLLKKLDVLVSGKTKLVDEDAHKLGLVLPAVKLLNSWISYPENFKLFSSLPSLDGIETDRFSVPIWKHLVSLCNCLENMVANETFPDKVLSAPRANYVAVSLPEEVLASSFHDVFDSNPQRYYMPKGSPLTMCATIIRLKSVQQTLEYLHGMDLDPPKLTFDDSLGCFVALNNTRSRDSSPAPDLQRRRCDSQTEDQIEEERVTDLSEEVSQLKIQTEAAKMKQAAHTREMESKGFTIEIRPQILVPDTNAFIDYLTPLKKLAHMKKFNIYCSTVVLKELEGLSRHVDSEWVANQAVEALKLVTELVETSNSRVKVVTTKGSVMNSTQFHEEYEYTPNSKDQNDDRIVSTCVQLVDISQDNQHLLKRCVVLLTNDRPMRIKASTKNIPARSLHSFLQWLDDNP